MYNKTLISYEAHSDALYQLPANLQSLSIQQNMTHQNNSSD